MNEPRTSYRLWLAPVPHCLADITGYLVDIAAAKACFEMQLTMSPSSENQLTIGEALSTAAIIRYCRCFSTGNRQKLDIKSLSAANSDEVAIHERMRGVRDWHVAHPINLQEVHALHLIVDETPHAEPLVLGLSSYQATSRPLKDEELHSALSICNKWMSFLQGKLVEEQLRLKPHVDELSREQVLALPIEDPEPNTNILARRKQTQQVMPNPSIARTSSGKPGAASHVKR